MLEIQPSKLRQDAELLVQIASTLDKLHRDTQAFSVRLVASDLCAAADALDELRCPVRRAGRPALRVVES